MIVMTAQQNAAFVELVQAWKHRHSLRSCGAQVSDLGAARIALEDARAEMSRSLQLHR
jgi:hypothetical protein